MKHPDHRCFQIQSRVRFVVAVGLAIGCFSSGCWPKRTVCWFNEETEARRYLSEFSDMAPGDAFEQSVIAHAVTNLLENGNAHMAYELARAEMFDGPMLTPEPFSNPTDRSFRSLLRKQTESGRWNEAAGLMLTRANMLPAIVSVLISENGTAPDLPSQSLSVTNMTMESAETH